MAIKFNFSALFCIYNTTVFMDRVCIPGADVMQVMTNLTDSLTKQIDLSQMQSWVDDIKNSWKIISISIAGAFFLGVLYMFFIRIFSGVIVWAFIILYFGALLALGVFLYEKSVDYKTYIDNNGEKDPYTNNN